MFLGSFVLDLSANTYQMRHVNLRPWPLTLEVTALVVDTGLRGPSVPSLNFVGLPVRKILDIYCVSINPPGDLDLWPLNPKAVYTSNVFQGHSLYHIWLLYDRDHSFLSWQTDWLENPTHAVGNNTSFRTTIAFDSHSLGGDTSIITLQSHNRCQSLLPRWRHRQEQYGVGSHSMSTF